MDAQEFWGWFIEQETQFFDFDPERVAEREEIFDRLASKLQEIDPNLTFEFGPKTLPREFIVSAGGIRVSFPSVVKLVDAAPRLNRWKIVAFRPRRPHLNMVEFCGKRVHPDDVQFTLIDDRQKVSVYLYVPGFHQDDSELKQIGYLLLDDTLGEYDVETRLGGIKMLSPDVKTAGPRYRLAELPNLFDQLVLRIEGRSERPS